MKREEEAVISQYAPFLDLMRKRRSIRRFEPRSVPPSMVEILLKAFDSAPLAGGDRGRRCLMISDREVIRLLAEKGQQAYLAFLSSIESPFLKEAMDNYGQNFFWFSEAPLIAAAVVRCPPSFLDTFCGPEAALFWGGHLSAAMGIENLLLMAPALGLGGCCLGGPLIVRTALAELLNFGPREELSLIAALGFSSES